MENRFSVIARCKIAYERQQKTFTLGEGEGEGEVSIFCYKNILIMFPIPGRGLLIPFLIS